jgi:hypothetical protein
MNSYELVGQLVYRIKEPSETAILPKVRESLVNLNVPDRSIEEAIKGPGGIVAENVIKGITGGDFIYPL